MKYSKDNSKTLAVRLSLEEYERLLRIAPKGKVSEYVRERIFDVPGDSVSGKDRFELAMCFTDDFMEDLMVKSRTVVEKEDNAKKRAKFLHDLVIHAEMVAKDGTVAFSPNMTFEQRNFLKNILPTLHIPDDAVSTDYNTKQIISFEFDTQSGIKKFQSGDFEFPYLKEKYLKQKSVSQ